MKAPVKTRSRVGLCLLPNAWRDGVAIAGGTARGVLGILGRPQAPEWKGRRGVQCGVPLPLRSGKK